MEATKLTIQEFWEAADRPEYEDQQLELHNGALIIMPPPKPYNSEIAIKIATYLNVFVMEHDLGRVTGADGAYQISDETLYVPDVAFIAHNDIPSSYERGISRVYEAAPTIAVEVISPSDQARKKTRTYLEAGTQVVWNVYSEDQTVDVVRLDAENNLVTKTLSAQDTLSGRGVLAGFEVAVILIFR